jgi:hypothetical protein
VSCRFSNGMGMQLGLLSHPNPREAIKNRHQARSLGHFLTGKQKRGKSPFF